MFDLKRRENIATNRQAVAVLDVYGEALTRLKNVVGIGVVLVGDDRPEEQVMGVFVARKVPIAELDREEIVPAACATGAIINARQSEALAVTRSNLRVALKFFVGRRFATFTKSCSLVRHVIIDDILKSGDRHPLYRYRIQGLRYSPQKKNG